MSDQDKVVSMGEQRGFAALLRRSLNSVSSFDERLNKIPSSWRIAMSALTVSIVVFALGLLSYNVGRESAQADAARRYETAVSVVRAEKRQELAHKDSLYQNQIQALAEAYEKELKRERAEARARIAKAQRRADAQAARAGKTIRRLKADNAKYRDYFEKTPPAAVAGIIWPDDGVRGNAAGPGARIQDGAAVHGGQVADSAAAVSAGTR